MATITAAAYGLQQIPGLSGVSPMISAIFIGIVFANLTTVPPGARPGVALLGKTALRVAVALLGLQLTLAQVFVIGAPSMLALCLLVALTFLATVYIGRLLGVEPGLARILAVGISVCGASAIAALAAVEDSDKEDVAYAIACVTLLGTAAMLFYPVIAELSDLTAHQYGFWVGSTVHEVAQVVAAGYQHSHEAGETSVVVKLSRVLLLAPLIVFLGWLTHRRGAMRDTLRPQQIMPTFVLAFIVLMLLNTAGFVPQPAARALNATTPVILTAALGAIGLVTKFTSLRAKGTRPLLLAALSSVIIALMGYAFLVIQKVAWI